MVLTASPTLNPSPPGPTAATVPAASYPMRAGKSGCSRYSPLRNIDSARLSPSALTLIWTSPFLRRTTGAASGGRFEGAGSLRRAAPLRLAPGAGLGERAPHALGVVVLGVNRRAGLLPPR